MLKNKLSDYTEQEFLDLLKTVYSGNLSPDELEKFTDELSNFMDDGTDHPHGSDLIFYSTDCGIEDSPEAIIAELKRWYAEHGLQCFKDE